MAQGPCYREAVIAAEPFFYWQLDETSGSVANDSTPNNRDGTYVGSNLVQGSAGLVPSETSRSSVHFPGETTFPADDHVEFAHSEVTPTGLSFEFAFHADGMPTEDLDQTLVLSFYGGAPFAHQMMIENTNFDVTGSAPLVWRPYGETPEFPGFPLFDRLAHTISEGNTYHVVGTTAVNTPSRLYVNGVLVDEGPHIGFGAGNFSSLQPFDAWNVSGDGGDQAYGFDGRIDDVAIYLRALSAEEIAEHYELFLDCPIETCSLIETDGVLLVDTTYQDTSVTLMDPAPMVGHVYYIKNIGSGTATLDPGTLLIDDLPDYTLDPYDSVAIVTTGSAWYIVSDYRSSVS